MCLFNDNVQQYAAHNCVHTECNFITLIQKEFQIENLTPQQILELLNHFNLLDHPALSKAFNGNQYVQGVNHNHEHQIIHQNYANELQQFIENNLQKCLEKINCQQDLVKSQQTPSQINFFNNNMNIQNQLFSPQPMMGQKPQMMNPYSQAQEQQQQNIQSNSDKIIEQIAVNCLDKLLESSVVQTKMLSEIQKSQTSFENSLTSLIDSVSVLKNITQSIVKANDQKCQQQYQYQQQQQQIQVREVSQCNSFETSSNSGSQHLLNQSEMSSQTLLKFLNPQNNSFQYKLVLADQLQLPLSREKNFNINVQLVNRYNEKIVNSNRIPISIQLYTCDNPPKRIEFNRTGQNVMKGVIEKDLVNGCAKFDKIHIKEVTSHFRNGWIFMVVYTKKSAFVNQQAPTNAFYQNVIDYENIQPLIIQQVKIRAKPLKEDKVVASQQSNNFELIKQIPKEKMELPIDNYIQKQIKTHNLNEICVENN